MRRDDVDLAKPPFNDRPSDPWMCGRTGQPCTAGPGRDGVCKHEEPCVPMRTWMGKRRILSFAAFGFFVAVMFLAVLPSLSPGVLKPGDLTTPHSQILANTNTSQRCGVCHTEASLSFSSWFGADTKGHADVSLTDRCLDCHHTSIKPAFSRFAHNLPKHMRDRITRVSNMPAEKSWHDMMPGPAVSQEDIACSACHREHRGKNASLIDLSDAQCQTCHSDRFGDFASSHPSWSTWPYRRGGSVGFDHQSHQKKHFPGTIQDGKAVAFDCLSCHKETAGGELLRAPSFEEGCASCHNESLEIQAAKGLELVALPTLPEDLVAKIGSWPENATGFPDGQLTPLAELLLGKNTATAARQFPNRMFGNLDTDNESQVAALQQIAIEQRALIAELGNQGAKGISDRIAVPGVTPEAVQNLLRSLPPQMVADTYEHWFQQARTQSVASARNVRQAGFRRSTDSMRLPSNQRDSKVVPSEIPLLSTRSDRLTITLPAKTELAALVAAGQDGLLQDAIDDDDPLAEDPLAADPLNQEPPSEDPLAGDPLAIDPLSADPLDSDPLSADPLSDDPLSADPLHADPLASDPLNSDPLSGDPLNPDPIRDLDKQPEYQRVEFDPETMLPQGGWYRDDLSMSIRYRGSGHEDPVLKSVLEIMSQLPKGSSIRESLLKTQAVSSCLSCHPGAIRVEPTWVSEPLVGARSEFTKFAHKPHLNIAQLRDCTHCHQVSDILTKPGARVNLVSNALGDSGFMQSEFAPLEKAACASCHHKRAAGDTCVTCHRYHIQP